MSAGIRGATVQASYTMDNGVNIKIKVPKYLFDVPGNGLTPATGNEVRKPARFKPRVMFWEGLIPASGTTPEITIRRSIPFELSALISRTDIRAPLTVDGVIGILTGRRGEKVTLD